MVTFADRLKQLRKENDITLEELARELNSTKATLSRYENEMRQPKIDFIHKIADYFSVSVDYLLGRINNPWPEPPIKNKNLYNAAARANKLPEYNVEKVAKMFHKLLEVEEESLKRKDET